MRGVAHGLPALAAIVTFLAFASTSAQATQPQPLNLRVAGGADTWHPVNDFRLDWDPPRDGEHQLPVAAIHFRLRDSAGQVALPETRFPWDANQLEYIHVPSGPGRYTADVWLEGPGGETGTPVSAPLLFDDVRPGPAQPLAPAGWIAGGAIASVRLEPPPAPWPLSGIRGYAVSVDNGSGSAPCAGPTGCSLDETDLRGGAGDDTISLGLLPEGINVVRAVAVSGSGMRSPQAMSAIVRVDATEPDVTLSAPRGWVDGPASVVAFAADAQSGMAAVGPSGPYTAISIDGGAPRTDPGGSATATVSGEGTHNVSFYARDAAGNTGDARARAATVRIDETPPRVAFAGSQDPAEPERIEATVDDALAGPDPSRGSIALRPTGSRQRFVPLPTVVSRGRLVAHWDSDVFPPRTYEFRASGYDVAGNGAESDRRVDGTRMVLVNPVKAPTRIAGGFGGARLVWQRCSRRDGQRRCRPETIEAFESRPTTRTVPCGRGVSYSGRLTAVSGSGLGGISIEVIETFDPGSEPSRRTTTVQTAADGTFVARLAPGPSRQIEAVFAGNRTLTRASGGTVSLRTRADVRMHASTASARVGGAPVVFSGRVGDLGAPIPVGGRPVELQFRFTGAEWSEFRTVRTDARGRFRYAYAFSDDDSRGIRFQFRAYAPTESGWPYEPAASLPVIVAGR